MITAACALAVLVGACFVEGVLFKVAALGILGVSFAVLAWLRILHPNERALVRRWRRGPASPN